MLWYNLMRLQGVHGMVEPLHLVQGVGLKLWAPMRSMVGLRHVSCVCVCVGAGGGGLLPCSSPGRLV